MQIKLTMSYHLMLVRIAIIKKEEISLGKDVEKREPLYTVGGNLCSYNGKQCGESTKISKYNYNMIHNLGIYPKKMKSGC